MKIRKYQYLIVLQGWYNDVWEDLTCEDAHSAVTTDRVSGKIVTPLMRIRSDLRAYQQMRAVSFELFGGACYMRRNYFKHTKVTKRLCVRAPDPLNPYLYRGKHNLRYYVLDQREPGPDATWAWMCATTRYPHEAVAPLMRYHTIYVFQGRRCAAIYRQQETPGVHFPTATLVWEKA